MKSARLYTLVLGLLACRPTASSTTVEPQPGPPVFVEQVQSETDDREPQLPPITPGVCPEMVADFPSPFFEDRVLIRLPAGLEGDDLTAAAHYFVQLANPIYLPDCRDGDEHGVMITYAAVTLQFGKDGISPNAARESALNEFGYTEGVELIEGLDDPSARHFMWVVANPGTETRALVVVKLSSEFVAAILFEANENDWPALVDTFVKSGKRLSLLPN